MYDLTIPIEILPHGKGLELPMYATERSSGMDLRAAIEGLVILEPGTRFLVPCGFKINVPKGFEAQIRSRSGLSLNYGVVVLNSPGTIDADYVGEVKVILVNFGKEEFEITRGLKCAQMVIAPVAHAKLKAVNHLENHLEETQNYTSSRGESGFGSTGII